ncbi:hypothetical protein RclHR1_03130019 [Rhizophagus clarus]|uniref:Uncharacterized protein n=1 Tax=Rhizophagus clarus TaxID=94130 RepID=A0A2Z6S209_9GLOM|nr:hypothetical protein RclHR1_03130019 [Rhizophagus clarus]
MIKKSKGKEYKLEFGLSLRDKVTLLLKQSLLHDERSKDIGMNINMLKKNKINNKLFYTKESAPIRCFPLTKHYIELFI